MNGNPEDVFMNGSLILRKVDKSKEGKYTPSVYMDGVSKGDLKSIQLCVMGRLLLFVVTPVMLCKSAIN